MTPTAPASPSVSVIVPVKDGARWLGATLDALAAQGDDLEILVVDSASRDDSVAIARRAGARVIEIAAAQFGHGRTRNLAAEQATGDLLCFLTQDAQPRPGWIGAYREAMALDPQAGVAFGPHLPRPGASPMIARELREFFAGFCGPDGRPRVFAAGDAPFLSNVNACYRRACWSELRFPDVPYAEDRAFARALAGSAWRLVYHPGAAVLHSHDYGPLTFIRRYFDEYRAIHAVDGFVEPFGTRSKWPEIRSQVARDRRWMRDHGMAAPLRTAWSARSLWHHATRKAAMVAGTHPQRIPPVVQRAISLEPAHAPEATMIEGGAPSPWDIVLTLARDGPAPLAAPVPGMADAERLHIAVVIPPFTRGSGGHSTIFGLLGRLEERGHTITTWLHDADGAMIDKWPAVVRAELLEYFGATRGPVFKRFDDWFGADVALATGWDTAYRAMTLPGCRARAYLVQDREPEFYATSAQSLWATGSYTLDLEPIAVSGWLAEIVAEHHGRTPAVVDLGVDHATYRARDVPRAPATVIFYARAPTPRRAVPLGVLALAELHRRRPETRFVLFGDHDLVRYPFPYEHLGMAAPATLARRYATATVGLCLSLTNHSLVPHEMLACGLPCVELAGCSWEGVHGPGGPLLLAEPDPVALADALEHLLDDPAERERRAQAGIAAVAGRDWDGASRQLESALRDVLRRRETGGASPVA